MRSFLLLLDLTGCPDLADTKPLRTCDAADETVDCCTDADQCVAFFGGEFPYCATPGLETGRCVECTLDEHCTLDSYCVLDAPSGPFCAPIPEE